MLMYNSRFKVISTVEMTLKRLLYMSIAVLYLPKNPPPKKKILATPLTAKFLVSRINKEQLIASSIR